MCVLAKTQHVLLAVYKFLLFLIIIMSKVANMNQRVYS